MKKTNRSLFVLLTFICFKMSSQQISLFNTYSYDLMQLNIAAAGRTCFEANLNYRAQWVGIKESPRLYQLSAGLILDKSSGLGVKAYQYNLGLIRVTNATIGYSYRAKLNNTTMLHLGIGAAFQQNSFDANKTIVVESSDLSISNNYQRQRSNNFDSEAGVLLLNDKLTLGIGALHLYNSNKKLDVVKYKLNPEVNIVASYKFNKGKALEVEPWIVDRYTVGGSNVPEGMLNLKIKQMFTVGAGYRVNYGYLALLGFELGKVKIAYSFDYCSGKTAKAIGSSHQVLLGFDLCKKSTKTMPQETAPAPELVTPVQEVSKQPETAPIPKEVAKAEEAPKEKPVDIKQVVDEINQIATKIVFDKNSSAINNEMDNILKEVAEKILKYDLKIEIVGYASADGIPGRNLVLSDERALNTKAVLRKYGVNDQNMICKRGGVTNQLNTATEMNRTVRFDAVK